MDPLGSEVVGEEGCTFKDVVDIFFNQANSGTVFNIWTEFARELGIEAYQIEECKGDMLVNKLSIKDTFHKVLDIWKQNKTTEATLANLVKHLENINLNNVAEDLGKFISTANQLPHGGGQLFMPTLPTKPKYYIPRTLITRRVIDVKVFSSTRKDVFVVDGIDRHRLSQLAEKELTDKSSSQVCKQELSVRFILLEHFGDWALLCAKTTNPIHLLRHREERFNWVCTKGDISALQKASDAKNQNKTNEEELIEEIETDLQNQTNQAICISDSPGMGKSLLLASIGRQLQEKYPQRCIDRFHSHF